MRALGRFAAIVLALAFILTLVMLHLMQRQLAEVKASRDRVESGAPRASRPWPPREVAGASGPTGPSGASGASGPSGAAGARRARDASSIPPGAIW